MIETYASRNHIEHSLGEKIRFFHLDCLSSEVRLNVDFDLTLTVAAAMLYQRLASRLKGFTESTPQKIFRKFVNPQDASRSRARRSWFILKNVRTIPSSNKLSSINQPLPCPG